MFVVTKLGCFCEEPSVHVKPKYKDVFRTLKDERKAEYLVSRLLNSLAVVLNFNHTDTHTHPWCMPLLANISLQVAFGHVNWLFGADKHGMNNAGKHTFSCRQT